MSLVAFPRALPDGRFLVSQRDNLADWYLRFVPFKNQRAVWTQYPERFTETGADVIAPRRFIQCAILLPHPAIYASTFEVRGIEDNLRKTIVGEWQRAKISDNVWIDNQLATVAQRVVLATLIAEHGAVILLIEPEHAGAAAHVENRLVGCLSHGCSPAGAGIISLNSITQTHGLASQQRLESPP